MRVRVTVASAIHFHRGPGWAKRAKKVKGYNGRNTKGDKKVSHAFCSLYRSSVIVNDDARKK